MRDAMCGFLYIINVSHVFSIHVYIGRSGFPIIKCLIMAYLYRKSYESIYQSMGNYPKKIIIFFFLYLFFQILKCFVFLIEIVYVLNLSSFFSQFVRLIPGKPKTFTKILKPSRCYYMFYYL